VNVDFSFEDDVEVVSRLAFSEDDDPVLCDSLTTVRGEPVIFVVGKPVKRVDAAKRCDDIRY
jgi:hypothetical protein